MYLIGTARHPNLENDVRGADMCQLRRQVAAILRAS